MEKNTLAINEKRPNFPQNYIRTILYKKYLSHIQSIDQWQKFYNEM